MTTDLVAAAEGVGALVRERADEAEANRGLTPDVVAALAGAGLFRMYVPAVYGGPEADPLTAVRAISAVAAADGAAGWCAMIASTTSSLAGVLAPDTARQVFGAAASVSGGAYAPTGRIVRDGDSWRANGRWQWGSGTDHCDWIAGGCLADDRVLRLLFFPAAEVRLIDTWHASGLRATASGDFEVVDVLVPDEFTVRPGIDPPTVDATLARFPLFTLLASGVAAATLGMARRAIDELVALAQGKRPAFSARTLAASPHTQLEAARAEGILGGARAFLLDELGVAWDLALRGDPVPVLQRARIRIACSHAAVESARAVDLAYGLGGGSSVFAENQLQRCFRDVHTATQHLMVSHRPMETAGKLLLGLDADASMI